MQETAETAANPVLQYLAIMSAGRDFGLSQPELVRVAKRFHPLDISPRALADVLVDALTGRKPA